MWSRIFSALFVASAIGVILAQQQQMSQCRTTFINSLYKCVSNSSMEVTSFLWLVTNQTSGSAPANMEQFKQTACSKQTEVTQCGIDFMRQIMNSTLCNPANQQDERPAIDTNFRSIFGQLDMICAHPCRATLVSDLRKCYTVAELDPELFLSNATMGRGAVIGTTEKDVSQYCGHKDALTKCMKEKRDACPEAPVILRAIGLDIESMDTGVNILCSHPDVYLKGIDCFEEPTTGVEKCQQDQNQMMINLMMTAQQTEMKEDVFFENFCKIRVKHVDCDLKQWALKKHTSCTDVVIGLRTEMECGLLPAQCMDLEKDRLTVVCHLDAFKRNNRKDSGSSTINMSVCLTAAFVLLSQLLKSH
ncbi:hypothetical protein SNE40_014016 [Patella caerulea]|uniref:Uncharacterized protein n=1 Tax=Patella caerulea TaxID=87958 RepID=A0AAN8PPX4_PATCE